MTVLSISSLAEVPLTIQETVSILYWKTAEPIPFALPRKLRELHCEFLIKLPELPDTIETLNCNSVTILPKILPESLKRLSCNSVRKLPSFLPKSMYVLNCNSVNKLPVTQLKSLKRLSCISAINTDFSELSNLETLYCNINNKDSKLPERLVSVTYVVLSAIHLSKQKAA